MLVFARHGLGKLRIQETEKLSILVFPSSGLAPNKDTQILYPYLGKVFHGKLRIHVIFAKECICGAVLAWRDLSKLRIPRFVRNYVILFSHGVP